MYENVTSGPSQICQSCYCEWINLSMLVMVFAFRFQPRDVWQEMENNINFYWMTGETPASLQQIVDRIRDDVEQPRNGNGTQIRPHKLTTRNRVMAVYMWMTKYGTLSTISERFGVSYVTIQRDVEHILPIINQRISRPMIRWPTDQEFRNFRGSYPEFPDVVGLVDGTPHWINRPRGPLQRLYYSGFRHGHVSNWIVMVDPNGDFRYSRPGFMGHMHDSRCYRNTRLPHARLPNRLRFAGDTAFPQGRNMLTLAGVAGRRRQRAFKRMRVGVEHRIGHLKGSYKAVGHRRFRGRRPTIPVAATACMGSFNRKSRLIESLRLSAIVNM